MSRPTAVVPGQAAIPGRTLAVSGSAHVFAKIPACAGMMPEG